MKINEKSYDVFEKFGVYNSILNIRNSFFYEEEIEMPDSKDLKEKDDIKDKIMDSVIKYSDKLSEANTQNVIELYLKNNTNIKDPELIATLLNDKVLDAAKNVDLGQLKKIAKFKGMESLESLEKYISLANKISKIAGDVNNATEMIKDFKKAKETQDEIEQINRSLRNPKGVNIEKLKKRKEELEIVKFELDKEGSMKFLDCMAEITSNVPIVGDTYSEVIKMLGQKIIPISNYSFNYSEVIRLYKEMAFEGKGISDEQFNALVKNGLVSTGDPNEYFNGLEELKALKRSGLLELIEKTKNFVYIRDSYELSSACDTIDFKLDFFRAYPEIWKHIKAGVDGIDIVFVDNHVGGFVNSRSPGKLNEGRKNATRQFKFDPLVVDLDNDGFDMLNSENGVHFDLDGDILKEKTTWISKKDGFLSIDLNDNGKIDNGAELFGDTFMLADGKYARSAIEALTSLDKNRDGVIDAKDEVYSKLRIWRDENGNGISEAGELKSLADYNITSINIADVKDENVDINGSTLEKTISFERQEKIMENNIEKTITSKGKIGEFLLERDIIDSIDEDILSTIPKDDAQSQAIIDRIKKLPNIRSYGKVRSLHNEMFLDKSGELLGLVENFVNSKDSEEKNELLDKILIKLGKAENISDTQSGQYINGKYVKILESFFGEDLERGSLSFVRAGLYNQSFSDLKLMYYSMLTINSVFKDMQDAFDISDNKLVKIKALNRYIRLATIADLENAGNIFDSASRVLLYLKSLGIEGFDEFKDYFGSISSGYIDRIGKLNYKIITGTDKSETIYSNVRGVTVIAGDGDDKIEMGSGDFTDGDYFYGGKGNDLIDGSSGSDTYIFNLGDGQDIIKEYAQKGDKNVIALGKGITKDNIIFKKINEWDLEIKVRGTDDKITVKNQFGSKSAIDKVYFYEGGSLTDADINEILTHITDGDDYIRFDDKDNYIDLLDGDDVAFAGNGNDTIICGKGNDVLDAGNGNNTFIYNVGDGHDIISAGMYGYNKIVFGEGIKKEDLIIAHTRIPESRMGISEVTIAFKNNKNDSLKISSQQHSPIISLLQFADGSTMDYKEMKEMFSKPSILDDFIEGTSQADTLYGLEGNDSLRGYSGDDIIYGGSGDDLLNGGDGDDIIDGGIGNDTLYGEGGNDTYIFGRGYGVDRINDIGWNEKDDKDTILFKEGITKDDLIFTRTASDVMEIKIKDTDDKIILENLFDSRHGVEQFKFADGTVYKLKDIEKELSVIRGTEKDDKLSSFDSRGFTLEGYEGNDEIRGSYGDDVLDGGTGNDILYGNGGNDTYIFGRGYGVDKIYDGGGGLDTIEFKEDISMDDLEFVRISSYEGEIRIKNSDDKIVLSGIFDKSDGVEQLSFADGTICKLEDIRKEFAIINGTDKAEELTAYDSVTGYTIYAGAGDDSIYGGKNNDKIYGQAGDDFILAYEGNDTLYGGSGNDQLYGREGNDILEGGEGNDVLYGGDGDDTYIFGRGDGVDTIHDAVGGLDTIQFKEGISKDDIEFVRTAHDEAELRIKGTDDKIILRKLFDSKEGVEQLQFFDGSIYKIEDFKEQLRVIKGSDKDESISAFNAEGYKIYAGAGNDSIYGGSGNDVIYGQAGDDFILAYEGNDTLYGGSGNDQLYGREGNDILEGGEGNDVLYGGDGDDTYIFGRGDGVDTIHDAVGGLDTIQFKEGISKDDIEFVRTAHDEAELRIKGTGDKIILRKLFDSKEGVEQLKFSDGSIYKIADLREEFATTRGSASHENLYAYDEEVGNTVYAGGGDDTIYGSKNADKIYAEEGGDYILARAGDDVIYGGVGNDTIYGEEGNDILEGGVGNDYLNGGAGNDTYVFSKGDGKDTIYDQDSNPNNKDRIQLGYDILNTVFKRDGSNLCIGFADSTDTITINNWYSGTSYQIEEIKSSDNRSITNVQLQLMIDAMAAYTKDKGIDWNTAVKQNPNEVNSILQNFWVANSN